MTKQATTTKRDAYEAVTDRIIEALEAGTVPWRQPWASVAQQNAITKRRYSGINVLVLALTAHERGYADTRWCTYKQAAGAGGNVRKGEKGTQVVFWNFVERKGESDEVQRIPFLRVYTVFNVEQCDGLELEPLVPPSEFDPIAAAEQIAAGYVDGPSVAHDASSAYYVPSLDAVHLPPVERFESADAYYGTLFHELSHSTGHASRLARKEIGAGAMFGSATYSREELVAEFGAAFLCSAAGIDQSRLPQSAAYISGWLSVLKGDRKLAVIAAGQGQKAADRILGEEVN